MLSFLRAFPPSSCKPGRRREWAATPKVKDCRDVLATCNKNWAGNIADEDRVGESGNPHMGEKEKKKKPTRAACWMDGLLFSPQCFQSDQPEYGGFKHISTGNIRGPNK